MPSDKGEVVLGVDLDGVCADFYARMREIAAEWLEVELSSLTKDVSYGLTEWGIRDEDHYRQLHRFAVTQRDIFEPCAPIKGAASGPLAVTQVPSVMTAALRSTWITAAI